MSTTEHDIAKGAGRRPRSRPALMDHLAVCSLLGVNASTWRSRVATGTAPLPHSRMGKHSYYRTRDVDYFIENGVWPEGTKFNRRGGG